ncbi:MAG: acetolactate synthase small subunit [Clostridia bacterium]|nr:acetolactate synthase small subunit [Lachnospiraceae bacterium]NCC01389.1 acetolactate synthase small subunit [Clostridia bacterium]NCD03212.1 acetolactate synthase small subunit [Clostridia bacterium]
MKGIFSVLVENRSGVLSKTAGLFARRGYNIDSLAVGETENPEISNMTIVSTGDVRVIDQIEKQLNKKIDVIKVRRLKEQQSIARESLMIKVSYNNTNRKDIMEICMIMNAKIAHVSVKSMIVELNASPEVADSFIKIIQPYGIIEMARTGVIALQKDE